MDYEKIYNSICSTAKNEIKTRFENKKAKLEYYEGHHITPKCLGGKGKSSEIHHPNIVLLTAKEHFICHRLLCEIYPGNKSLIHAFWKMVLGGDLNQKRFKCSSKTYEYARKLQSKIMSTSQKGKSVYDRFGENADKIKLFTSDESNPMKGTNLKNIWISKYGLDIGIKKYNEWKLNCSKAKIGKKVKTAICPHCKMEAMVTNIRRFHLDNCKLKK